MSENTPHKIEIDATKHTGESENRLQRIIYLTEILTTSLEKLSFPGILEESYARHKEFEAECPGYSTPIDELLSRFRNEGMKVTLGKNPQNGNVFVLPYLSDDIENDCLMPEHLQVSDEMDPVLKEIVELCKK